VSRVTLGAVAAMGKRLGMPRELGLFSGCPTWASRAWACDDDDPLPLGRAISRQGSHDRIHILTRDEVRV